jgi:hypothetical protein
MAKYLCDCGEFIRTSGDIPNPLEWFLISATEYDSFQGQIDAEALLQRMTSLFQCPRCATLWIFWIGFNGEPTVYRLAKLGVPAAR